MSGQIKRAGLEPAKNDITRADLGNLCQMFEKDVTAIRDAIKGGHTREAVNKCEATLKSIMIIRRGNPHGCPFEM
jgi:hypothetical protein